MDILLLVIMVITILLSIIGFLPWIISLGILAILMIIMEIRDGKNIFEAIGSVFVSFLIVIKKTKMILGQTVMRNMVKT